MQTAELIALPLAERLAAMEALWESLCRDSSQSPDTPDWHQEVLSERLIALDRGTESVSPWPEAKERIRLRAQSQDRSGQ